jgi:hypothetical protein
MSDSVLNSTTKESACEFLIILLLHVHVQSVVFGVHTRVHYLYYVMLSYRTALVGSMITVLALHLKVSFHDQAHPTVVLL